MLFTCEQVADEWFAEKVIFHFCSNTLTEQGIAECTEYAVNKALKSNAIVSFDVNLRHNLWPQSKADIDIVNKLIKSAHVIKFSLDEFNYLARGNKDEYLAFCFKWNCQFVIITDGEKAIACHTANNSYIVQPPAITAIDTTAGGDGFIGGFLYSLSLFEQIEELLESDKLLKKIIEFSAQCGAIAVSKPGAFPALATLDEVLPKLTTQQISTSQNQALSLDVFLRS